MVQFSEKIRLTLETVFGLNSLNAVYEVCCAAA